METRYYKWVDLFFLLCIMLFIKSIQGKIYQMTLTSVGCYYLGRNLAFLFIAVYVLRLLFRPPYEEVVRLYHKGYKINGALNMRQTPQYYRSAYAFWAKLTLTLLSFECLMYIIIGRLIGSRVSQRALIIHMVCVIAIQIIVYIWTRFIWEKKFRILTDKE